MLVLLSLACQASVAFAQDTALEPGLNPNTIRWATASEHENFAFDIFRGPSEDGPFERINSEPVPGAGTTDLPQRYEYQDSDIEAGKIYWYYVESISLSGERRRVTPIYPSKPKPSSMTDG